MQPWQADRLVERFRRLCRLAGAGKLDAAGLADRTYDLLAAAPPPDPAVIPRLAAHLPAAFRVEFAAALRRATSEDFLLPLWIRDGAPRTLKELEADAAERSAHVRAWARLWSSLSPSGRAARPESSTGVEDSLPTFGDTTASRRTDHAGGE